MPCVYCCKVCRLRLWRRSPSRTVGLRATSSWSPRSVMARARTASISRASPTARSCSSPTRRAYSREISISRVLPDFYGCLDAARILRDMCICCIGQKIEETVKDVWVFLKTFLSTEHPGLNNVANFLTVIISAASIIIAFASYNYTKDHDQPIYDVVLTSGAYQGVGSDYLSGTDFTTCIGTVPPGKFTAYVPYPGEGMHARVESAIAFRDNKGNDWIRDAKGILSEIKTNPYEYLKLDLPPENWQSLESE